MRDKRFLKLGVCILLTMGAATAPSCYSATPPTQAELKAKQPNIFWIYIEDMNPSLGCYGDPTVPTPNMDKLAKNGVLFEQCYVPAGVCSPTRSALITGKMQTSIGAHNHNSAYNKNTPIHLPEYLQGKTLPEIFQENGYRTFNQGKDHYNFTFDREALYSMQHVRKNHMAPWRELPQNDKPWFGQIMLMGGKEVFGSGLAGKLKPEERLSPSEAAKTLPPYYPQDEVFVKHWAMHYDCIQVTDKKVGRLMANLEADGLLDNTVVILFSDHGCYLPRHKQFCYEGSLHVPLIISAPKGLEMQPDGTRRKDLVSGIDIAATSLAYAGIHIPKWYDGKNVFAPDFKHAFLVGAKDRMDFTIDRVRSIRMPDGMKYIRNFMTDRPFMQLNYRHGREYMVRIDTLFAEGKLSGSVARFFSNYRPAEELYDLNKDPHEMHNLAHDPAYQSKLLEMRARLDRWVTETDDKGQYPEDEPNLRETYRLWKTKCVNPEYDKFKAEQGLK